MHSPKWSILAPAIALLLAQTGTNAAVTHTTYRLSGPNPPTPSDAGQWGGAMVLAADLDGDGTLEVVVTAGTDDDLSTVEPVLNVWSTSSPRPSWPAGQASLNAWPMTYHDAMNTSAFPLNPRKHPTA